jgi:hypothetical protein
MKTSLRALVVACVIVGAAAIPAAGAQDWRYDDWSARTRAEIREQVRDAIREARSAMRDAMRDAWRAHRDALREAARIHRDAYRSLERHHDYWHDRHRDHQQD